MKTICTIAVSFFLTANLFAQDNSKSNLVKPIVGPSTPKEASSIVSDFRARDYGRDDRDFGRGMNQLDRIEAKLDRLTNLLLRDRGDDRYGRDINSSVDMTCFGSLINTFSDEREKISAANNCRNILPESMRCELVQATHNSTCFNRIVNTFSTERVRLDAMQACQDRVYHCD